MYRHILFPALLVTLWLAPLAAPKNLPRVPKGLDIVDWGQIRAEYERRRHAAFPDEAGFHARNFGQQWLARFDGRGVSVEPDGQIWFPFTLVASLSSSDGSIVANAALVPASAGGAVNASASHATHLILDINGYFAP